MISIPLSFKNGTYGAISYWTPYTYAKIIDTVFEVDARFMSFKLGIKVCISRSIGTGISPCSSAILVISGIVIPVNNTSEP